MKANEFTTMLRAWRARCGWSDVRAAVELGCRYGTMRHWLAGRAVPDYFAMCAVVRQIREGRDPLTAVEMTATEFADTLKRWRAEHGFTQREAGAAIGTCAETIRGWESQDGPPRQPALSEILRRLRMPVDVELVKQATKRPRPIEPTKFAEAVRAWRRSHRLTQAEAAAILGTSPRNVWVWQSARALPRRPLAMLARLAEPFTRPAPRKSKLIEPRRFAEMLRRWRRGHRLTQAQACAALRLPPDQALISDYERRNAFPQPDRLRTILNAIASRPAPPPPPRIRPSPFARGLRKWRKFRHLTLAEAAAIFGCSVSALCHYENGRAEPPAHRRAAIVAIIDD